MKNKKYTFGFLSKNEYNTKVIQIFLCFYQNFSSWQFRDTNHHLLQNHYYYYYYLTKPISTLHLRLLVDAPLPVVKDRAQFLRRFFYFVQFRDQKQQQRQNFQT